MKKENNQFTAPEFIRLANNFYNSKQINVDATRYAIDADLLNYISVRKDDLKQKYKVAFVWICLNPPYWQYAKNMIEGARNFFLPGHEVDYFLWSDMKLDSEQWLVQRMMENTSPEFLPQVMQLAKEIMALKDKATVFDTEPVEWPMPTLMRYHLFLQQEEILSNYDYIFYCDVDMQFVNIVGDEVLGDGLTAALHPGYAIDKKFWPPYEPNENSTAYIKRPGRVIDDGGKPRFMPMYYAGGFQGGKSKEFIQAMKAMKKTIDADFSKNYVAIWNDESHWNKYLSEHQPAVVLTPSYIYPDSLINEYYIPLWGVNYPPRLVTLTKKFSTSAEGGAAAAQMIEQMKGLRK